MKRLLTVIVLFSFITSCGIIGSLNSNTSIMPNDSFILGNNNHGKFKVKLKNVSEAVLEVYHAPVGGGRHSAQTLQPGQSATVHVSKNTALVIANTTNVPASVNLKVTGDLGLSMQYKK